MTRPLHAREDANGAGGSALIVAVLALALVAAVSASLALSSSSEAIVAGDFARSQEVRYAAEAGLERAMADLRKIDDWSTLPGGDAMSGLTDGPPVGVRQLPGGATLDLARIVSLANCGKATACTSTDVMGNGTGQRPWGANNPVWRVFAYAPLAALLPAGGVQSATYVVVLIADDPSETDANPAVDGVEPCVDGQEPPACNPGSGVLALRAEAFGPRGAHATLEAIVERPPIPGGPLRTRTELLSGVR
jgi:hypothetical protein